MTTATKISEPSILTANTYFWSSAMTSSNRHRNEERRTDEVANFLTSLGFELTKNDTNNVIGELNGLEVHFHYSESCKNVYKSLAIYRNGRKSNITALRKLY